MPLQASQKIKTINMYCIKKSVKDFLRKWNYSCFANKDTFLCLYMIKLKKREREREREKAFISFSENYLIELCSRIQKI